MWSMLEMGLTYDALTGPDGVWIASTETVDITAAIHRFPGVKPRIDDDFAKAGVYRLLLEGAPSERVPWRIVRMSVIAHLCAAGWEPYAYGSETSAAWSLYLFRKRRDTSGAGPDRR